ncbi:MAG TPA: flagellar basal-body rod protein FlgF [Spirochaetota bacterium]|nr:flagellar basal-body rod protein FlgF [Spirochaetota bacterium]HOM37718.1 flagellar basal-body rod protein FlgF [Spirochaetota bacterium]HPQ49676.1 flagellar basal-body rod protein FlgF [Spirochaetota bacterium]
MNIGMYSAASGMLAQWTALDIASNNLANVNTTGFKKDEVLFKAFPERLMSRFYDNVVKIPLGSIDKSPIVGKMGTGVEVNEVITRFEKRDGETIIPFKKTDNKFDLALDGEGFFTIATDKGERYTRAGAFTINQDGILVDMNGFPVLGEKGIINVGYADFKVDEFGNVAIKQDLSMEWEVIDKLKLVDFYDKRGIVKEGKNYYYWTKEAGEIKEPENLKVLQGFLEGSNVNPVIEMTKLIEIQRAYEACQKAVQSEDQLLGRAVNDILNMRG